MAEQLTESHKEALRDLNEKKSQLNAELVSLGLLKLSIEKREKNLSIFYEHVSKLEKEIGQKIYKDYGDVTINPDTLEFIRKNPK